MRDLLQHTDHPLAVGRNKDQRKVVSCGIFAQGADYIVAAAELAVQRANAGIFLVLDEAVDHGGWDAAAVAAAAPVRLHPQQDIARKVGQQNAHLVLFGRIFERGIQHGDVERIPGLYGQTGQLSDRLGGCIQLQDLLALGIAVYLIKEGAARQAKDHQDQDHR